MNYIQTLYIDKSKHPFENCFGWAKPEFHLMGWTLSCLQLNKMYGKVELYANSEAAKLLIDTLNLPYSKANITHDNLCLANEKLWALPKILTYSLQERPFLHIDGDVFLFDHFSEPLLKSELIAQNIERATNFYFSTQKELLANFGYFPKCVIDDFNSHIPIMAVNAGILGGNNISFINEYSNIAFEYINRNITHLPLINVDRFNVFFEQHLFYSLAKERGIPIGLLYNEIINDNEYEFLANIHEVPCQRSYLHLLGNFKRDEIICLQMAAKLRDLYPEYYYKIIEICKKKNIPLVHHFYYNEKLENFNNFINLQEKAVEYYRKEIVTVASIANGFEGEKFRDEIPDLARLNQIYNIYAEDSNNYFDKSKFKMDFIAFSNRLIEVIKAKSKISDYYLYGRDIESVNWYCKIFSNLIELPNKIIIRCERLYIVESEFDWGGLMNKYKREGIEYYSELLLSRGQFFSLVIPEVSTNNFSLFDIDDFEKSILDHLTQPLSIKNLLLEMQIYVEDDVIKNNLETYNRLIIELLKQLVVKKAIKPIN